MTTTPIHALTLWQAWASLLALGPKRVETRSWATKVRGTVAIHAAGAPKFLWKNYRTRQWQNFAVHLEHCANQQLLDPSALPYGAVLAVGELVDCVPVEAIRDSLSDQERAFGDYSDGRFALIFEQVRQLEKPVPAKGGRKFWMWDAPARLAHPVIAAPPLVQLTLL